jgi:hypothetical protein
MTNNPSTTSSSITNLHSSSSSSDANEFAESYVHFGINPDTANASDPFNRFWGMLENMLDEVSNPVKFASAPLDYGAEELSAGQRIGTAQSRPAGPQIRRDGRDTIWQSGGTAGSAKIQSKGKGRMTGEEALLRLLLHVVCTTVGAGLDIAGVAS